MFTPERDFVEITSIGHNKQNVLSRLFSLSQHNYTKQSIRPILSIQIMKGRLDIAVPEGLTMMKMYNSMPLRNVPI
jgi:hypothetical protein